MMKMRFFIGKPCKHGHDGRRYVKGRQCVECLRGYRAAWRQAHPEKHRKSQRSWEERHPEKRRAYSIEFYAKYPERGKAASAAWRKANPEWRAIRQRERQVRKRKAPGNGLTVQEWRSLLTESLGICAYCNERRPLTMDHIEPLIRGGAHDVDNAAAVCRSCNSSKRQSPLLLWLARRAA